MTDLLMPSLSDQMEQGTIIKWLVEDGQQVTIGDELVEIETDKATMAVTAEHEGVLEIVAPEGETVAVGQLIARIGAAVAVSAEPGAAAPASAEPAPAGPAAAERAPVPAAPEQAPVAQSNGHGGTATITTPLARRVAQAHDVALDSLTGTGPRGRITKQDVFRAAGIEPEPEPVAAPAAAAPTAPRAPEPVPADARLEPATRLQQVIASRMTEQAAVPVFQVQTDVEMDAALALRAELKRLAADEPAPSVNDLIMRACALALRNHPMVNGSYREDGFLLHDRIHVGMAVATNAGLLVATIPDTDTKSLGQIARESRALAARVRDGEVTPVELSGGTFTVSNLGMFGMTEITAVINPPQAAILGVGAARTVLAREESGEIVDRQLVALNLSCDHRILNGADGSRFLQDVKALLETPLRMAL